MAKMASTDAHIGEIPTIKQKRNIWNVYRTIESDVDTSAVLAQTNQLKDKILILTNCLGTRLTAIVLISRDLTLKIPHIGVTGT